MARKLLMTASTMSHILHFHLPYLRRFGQLGWQVHVACGGAGESCPYADRLYPLPFEKRMWSLRNFSAALQLRRLIREQVYDLIVTHTALAAFFTRLALFGLRRRPKVVNVVHGYLFDHNTKPAKRWLLTAAERLTAGQTDLLLTMNDWDHRFALERKLCGNVENIPGIGVELSRFSRTDAADGQGLRRELGIPADGFVIVYAAELSERKNHETLIRAAALLPERVHLMLAGSGAAMERMRLLTASLGIGHRVHFLGYVNRIETVYEAADAAASSSRSEGLPFHVMEAMQMGLPVIASAVKGHTDLITHEVTGLLYPFGDAAACAAQLRRVLEDGAFAADLCAAARERVAAYDLQRVLPQVMAAYLRVLEEA